MTHDELLSELRGSDSFDLDKLKWSVFLLHRLFSTAAGNVPPVMAGAARPPEKEGKRRGTVENPAFHDLVFGLLTAVAIARGDLAIHKNKSLYPSGGTLVEALAILAARISLKA